VINAATCAFARSSPVRQA